jgi:hypothetical protein
VVYEDEKIRRVKIYLTDLQTGSHFSKEVSISKTVERKNDYGREVISQRMNSKKEVVFIVKATDDELANKEAAAVSKAIRNEGLRLIPADIVEEAMEMAKATREGKIKEDPVAYSRKVVDAFSEIAVSLEQLEKYLGHPIAESSPSELDNLRTIHGTIKSGEQTWASYASGEPEATKVEKAPPPAKKAKKSPAKKKAEPPVEDAVEDTTDYITKLQEKVMDEEVNWEKLGEFAKARDLDLKSQDDCSTILQSWESIKGKL